MNKLNKNRVFENASLTELGQNTIKLMDQAQTSSKTADKKLATLKTTLASIPSEAKVPGLAGKVESLAGTLSNDIFLDCKKTKEKIYMNRKRKNTQKDGQEKQEHGNIAKQKG